MLAKMIAEVGLGFLASAGKGMMAKRAASILVKGGLLSQSAAKGLAENPKAMMALLGRSRAGLGIGPFSYGSLAKLARQSVPMARAAGLRANRILFQAQGQMQLSSAMGGFSKILFGTGLATGAFSMLSSADTFFEKNMPSASQEIMQTQQMFLPRQAYTQRQRAIQAIHQSQMTTRAALGSESTYMH